MEGRLSELCLETVVKFSINEDVEHFHWLS